MQIGAICHAERLKQLLLNLDMKMSKKEALKIYSDSVISDSKLWRKLGIIDFNYNIDS